MRYALEGGRRGRNIALVSTRRKYTASWPMYSKVRKASIKGPQGGRRQLTRRRAGTREIETEVECGRPDQKAPTAGDDRDRHDEIVALSPSRTAPAGEDPGQGADLAETLGEPKTGPRSPVIVGGRSGRETQIPGTDEDAHEPPVGDG